MTSHEEIEVKINSAMMDKDFIDQKCVASDEDIHTIEYQLGFRLPQSLIWFLKKYGSGGVNGSTIYGVGLPSIITRLLTRPSNLWPRMVLANIGYCLVPTKMDGCSSWT